MSGTFDFRIFPRFLSPFGSNDCLRVPAIYALVKNMAGIPMENIMINNVFVILEARSLFLELNTKIIIE